MDHRQKALLPPIGLRPLQREQLLARPQPGSMPPLADDGHILGDVLLTLRLQPRLLDQASVFARRREEEVADGVRGRSCRCRERR